MPEDVRVEQTPQLPEVLVPTGRVESCHNVFRCHAAMVSDRYDIRVGESSGMTPGDEVVGNARRQWGR
jgi:hypothetical protein